MAFAVRALPCAVLGLVLTCGGCGGGGGSSSDGGGTTPPASGTVVVPTAIRSVPASTGSLLTASNYVDFAGPLARAVLSSTGDSLVGTTLGNGNVGAADAQRRSGAASTTVREALLVRPAATATNTVACTNGGTLTVTADDADGNSVLSIGDVLTLTASDCVISLGESPTDGGFTLTVAAIDLDASNNATGLDGKGTLAAFSVGSDATLAGDFELWAKQASSTLKQLRLSYGDVTSVFGSESLHYQFDIDTTVTTTGTTYAMNGGIVVSGQTYKLVQTTAFSVSDSDAPASGVVTLQDASGDKLTLTARAGGLLDFAFYPPGSTTPSATLPDQTWDSFRTAP